MTTVQHPPTRVEGCPETFEAETYVKESRAAYDLAKVDGKGQHPNMADQVNSQGAALLREQWDLLAPLTNPSWEPTYERVYPDDEKLGPTPTINEVADCPNCGTPIKVG